MKPSKTVDVCSQAWEVFRVSADKMPKGHEMDDGVTNVDANTIHLRDDLCAPKQVDAYMHEVFGHALWDSSGLGYWVGDFLRSRGFAEVDIERFEETFIRLHTPALVSLLEAEGVDTAKLLGGK